MSTARTNRYEGECCKCGAHVPANAGTLEGPPWRTFCATCLPRVAAGVKFEVRDGMVVSSLTGYLGPEFAVYRQAMGAWHYDRNAKANFGDASLLPETLRALAAADIGVYLDDDVKQMVETEVARQRAEVESATERTEAVDQELAAVGGALYPYQKTGVRWLASKPAALLADSMGLGKTLQALVAAPAGAPVLVVCPAVAKGVWMREAKKWRPDLTAVALKGRKSFRWPQPGEMVVVNYDILPEDCGDAPSGVVVVADEAHSVKSSKAQRTKRFRSIAKAARAAGGRVWLLTGTPLLNRPPELWALLAAAGLEKQVFGSWMRFAPMMGGRQKTIRARGRSIPVWEWGHDIDPSVPELLKAAMIRRLKEDVLTDLPAVRWESIDVNGLSKETQALADKALEAIGADLTKAEKDADATANMPSIPFEMISKARAALAMAKIPAMLAMVEEHEEQGEPLVVFSAHRAPVEALAGREGWATITGDIPPAERSEIEDRFQRGELQGIAATIQAGGVAITLTRASHALFVDRLFTPALNAQARDRIHRIGQTRGVLITDLVAEHALDRRLYELLATKEKLISETVDAAAVDGNKDVELLTEVSSRDLQTDLDEFEARLAALKAEENETVRREETRKAEEKLEQQISRRCETWGIAGNDSDRAKRGPLTAAEEWAVRAIVTLTAHNDDHAEFRNSVGWNRADQFLGHSLARFIDNGLTDAGWQMAVNLTAKYRRQVPN